MSRMIELNAVIAAWLEEARERDREPRHDETDEWFRPLGLSEAQIAESARIAAKDDDAGA